MHSQFCLLHLILPSTTILIFLSLFFSRTLPFHKDYVARFKEKSSKSIPFQHPGGQEVMQEYVGFDASVAFRGVGHSPDAMEMLSDLIVGILPMSERMFKNGTESSW